VAEKEFSKRAQLLMSQQTADLRLQPRIPSHQMVTIMIEGRAFPAYLRDISKTGAFLLTCADASKGMQLTIEIPKPGTNQKSIIQAEVVRVEHRPSAELKGVAFKFGPAKVETFEN